jgi:hypothetical protein
MSDMVSVNGQTMPRRHVRLGHVAPVLRLAAANAIKEAEYADNMGEDPRVTLATELLKLRQLVNEIAGELEDVRNKCYGKPGHDWSREHDYCNRCGADGRA